MNWPDVVLGVLIVWLVVVLIVTAVVGIRENKNRRAVSENFRRQENEWKSSHKQ